MTDTPEVPNKFAGLLALKDGPSTRAGQGASERSGITSTPSVIEKPSPEPKTQVRPAAAETPKPAKKTSPKEPEPVSGGTRLTINISPNSKIYGALEEGRAALPSIFQSQTLSSLLLKYLAEHDDKLAKEIKSFLSPD